MSLAVAAVPGQARTGHCGAGQHRPPPPAARRPPPAAQGGHHDEGAGPPKTSPRLWPNAARPACSRAPTTAARRRTSHGRPAAHRLIALIAGQRHRRGRRFRCRRVRRDRSAASVGAVLIRPQAGEGPPACVGVKTPSPGCRYPARPSPSAPEAQPEHRHRDRYRRRHGTACRPEIFSLTLIALNDSYASI